MLDQISPPEAVMPQKNYSASLKPKQKHWIERDFYHHGIQNVNEALLIEKVVTVLCSVQCAMVSSV